MYVLAEVLTTDPLFFHKPQTLHIPLATHHIRFRMSAPKLGACPVKHGGAQSESCPVPAAAPATAAPQVCPVPHQQQAVTPAIAEPVISDERRPLGAVGHGFVIDRPNNPNDPLEMIPESKIPAAGRGNSEDGSDWLNPSAGQLFRALSRKDKSIELKDAQGVADVHEWVTHQTWEEIMVYERLHAKSACRCVCRSSPSHFSLEDLAPIQLSQNLSEWTASGAQKRRSSIVSRSFCFLEGGCWSRNLTFLDRGLLPFDRHDWTVDRCGREVRYIIDYYSTDLPDGSTMYTVDARPELNVPGAFDRARVAFKNWREGKAWW